MRRILVLAGLLGGAFPAFSQSSPPSSISSATSQQSAPVFADTIVVSASVDEQPKDQTPATVTVITAPEIAARQATTVAELLRTVPGLALAQSGSAGHATSLFTRGTDSNHTLVLWNGVPLNEPFIGGYDWSSLPTEGVERVEVVRGPFSSVYGSAALGGVVQVLAGAPEGVSLRLENGDDGWVRGSLVAGHRAGNLDLGLTGHLQRGSGQLRNDFYDTSEAAANARWTFAPGMSIGVLARRNESSIGIPRSGATLTPHQQQDSNDSQIALPLRIEGGPWQLDGLLSQSSTDLIYKNPDDPFGYTRADTGTETNRARFAGTYRKRDGLSLSLGGDWARQKVTNSSVFGSNLDGTERRDWGAFGELRWSRGALTLDAGIRRDDDQAFGGHTSPRLGVRLQLPGAWSVRANYGEAFRAPSFSELYFPFSGNLALKPETSRGSELGVAWEPGAWTVRLTGFENQLRELIDFDFATFTSVNVGRARTRGVEAETGYAAPAWSARVNATYLEATNLEDGTQLLNRPRWSGNLVLGWSPRRWTLSGTWRYAGERRSYPYVALPSYSLVDFAAAWRVSDLLRPYARLQNVLDRRYEEIAGYPSPRRALVAGLALRF